MIVVRIHCSGGCGAKAYLRLGDLMTVSRGWRLSAVQRGPDEIEPRAWCPACVTSGVVPARTRSRIPLG